MRRQDEKRILVALLRRLEKPSEVPGWVHLIRPTLWLALVAASFFLFQLAPKAESYVLYVAIASALLGSATAVSLIYVSSRNQWPAISKHLDGESIRGRLREIDA